jgi:hypothetical protein
LALVIYIPIEIIVWTGLILDEVFFPKYHQVQVSQPVFIIGNPRSGTTFLQRLLARDTANFLSMHTWEIFGSPSILTRRLLRGAVAVGRAVGLPINRRIRKMEQLWKDDDRIHRLRLRTPEEDEYLFLHNFSTLKIWSFASLEEEAERYIYYDQKMSWEEKERNMAYYESCIQRHYFSYGCPDKKYLSKNPNFSPAIATLLDRFPDGKFIYLIRNPLDAVPSHISLKEREWQMLGSPMKRYACADFIIKTSEHWYNYPLKTLKGLPGDQAIIIKFDDLIQDAQGIINQIYNQFGFQMSERFAALLQTETGRARKHQSQHYYSLSEMGISSQEMTDRFGSVMEEYQFIV